MILNGPAQDSDSDNGEHVYPPYDERRDQIRTDRN